MLSDDRLRAAMAWAAAAEFHRALVEEPLPPLGADRGSIIAEYLQPFLLFSSFHMCSRARGAPWPLSAAGCLPPSRDSGRYALLAVVAGVADRVLVHLAEGLLRVGSGGERMCIRGI